MGVQSVAPPTQPNRDAARERRSARAAGVWLYLFLLGVYLLTAAARLANDDALSMYRVTQSLYEDQWIDADPCVAETQGNQCVPGVDGKNYSGYGVVSSLLAVPAYAMGAGAAAVLGKDVDLVAGAAVSLTNAFLTPLIAVVLFAWLLRLGYSTRVSVILAVVLGLGTPLWFHGVKGFHSEPHFTLGVLACGYLLSKRGYAAAAGAGVCFALAIGARVYGLILTPFLLLYLYQVTKRRGGSLGDTVRAALVVGVPLGVVGLLLALLNEIRFGSPTLTGYHLTFPSLGALFATPFWQGLRGVLLNGEVGLIWFTPLLLLLPFAWRAFHRVHPAESLLCLGVIVASILFFSKYGAWHGGWSYGPRLLVPVLPFAVLPLAEAVRRAVEGDGAGRLLGGVVIALSIAVQAVGITSSMARYYALSEYHELTGEYPWWYGSGILQNLDALPKLIAYDPGDPVAPGSAEAHLAALPNPINLFAPDVWWFKTASLGLPWPATLAVVLALAVGAALSALRLARLVRDEGTRREAWV